MKREDFEALVRRYEEKAEEDPAGLRRDINRFAALGFAYFGFLLFIALLLTVLICLLFYGFFTHGGKGGYGLIKLAIIVGGADCMLLQALWVRFPPPEGMRLRKEEMPLLFDDVEEIRSRLQCPPVDEIVLDDEFNAAMVQTPRLGVFGWYKNTLVIGLPFLHAMSRECVRAVIAHELGHLSGLHSQFSGRIYRVSEMWGRLASNADGAAGNVLVRRFVLWYAPRLQARAFALRRANEYEADAASVLITGSSETARLLIGIHARGRSFTRESERRIANMVREGGETPPGFATAACLIAKEPLQMGDAERALDLMVLEETDYFDTHPCLLDRLESIGYESTPADARTLFEQKGLWPIHFEKFAADEYLPGGDAELVRRLDDSMRKKEFVSGWVELQKHMAEQRVELSKLDAKMTEGPLTEEETLERAKLLKTVHGEIAALEWLQSESPKFPDQLVMRFMLGSLLLDEDHEEGVEILEEVGKKEPEVMDLACESIYNFYKRAGRHAEAREILLRADSHGEVSAKAQEERSIHKKTDKFMANDLSSEDLDALLAKLESEPTILKAWLLRKEVEHFAEKKAYLLVVKIKTRGFSNDQLEADLKAIQLILPALSTLKISFTVSGIDSCSVHLRTATKKVSGALIFERKKAKK